MNHVELSNKRDTLQNLICRNSKNEAVAWSSLSIYEPSESYRVDPWSYHKRTFPISSPKPVKNKLETIKSR